jgi:hypothetical protein
MLCAMLSYIVLAKNGDAKKVAKTSMPSKQFRNIDVKGIDPVKLGKLHAIVADKSYDAVKKSYGLAAEGGEEGPWVVRLDDELVGTIAGFDVSAAKKAWTAWAKIDEMKADKFDVAGVRLIVRAMCDMCRRARDDKQSLFLWMIP